MEAYNFQQFFNAWVSAHSISTSNKIPDNKDVSKAFDLLSEYPITAVISALDIHSKSSRFPPTPADICTIIGSRYGHEHICSDEAWAIALISFDEDETVMMTDEIFEARNIAHPQWLQGDKIGSRMTFKGSYERIVKTARKPKWRPVLGNDKSRIEPILQEAVRKDRLTQDQAARYLPGPTDGGVVGKLLTGKMIDEEDSQREFVSRFRDIMNEKFSEAEEKHKSEQQRKKNEEREALERRRQELLNQAVTQQNKKAS